MPSTPEDVSNKRFTRCGCARATTWARSTSSSTRSRPSWSPARGRTARHRTRLEPSTAGRRVGHPCRPSRGRSADPGQVAREAVSTDGTDGADGTTPRRSSNRWRRSPDGGPTHRASSRCGSWRPRSQERRRPPARAGQRRRRQAPGSARPAPRPSVPDDRGARPRPTVSSPTPGTGRPLDSETAERRQQLFGDLEKERDETQRARWRTSAPSSASTAPASRATSASSSTALDGNGDALRRAIPAADDHPPKRLKSLWGRGQQAHQTSNPATAAPAAGQRTACSHRREGTEPEVLGPRQRSAG